MRPLNFAALSKADFGTGRKLAADGSRTLL